jgi:protein ImuA
MAPASPPTSIAELRQWLAQAEGCRHAQAGVLPFGIAEPDEQLPAGGLALGHVHEVMEGGPASEYAGLAALFTAEILACLSGPVLWCLKGGHLFVPALDPARASGVVPARFAT